MKLENLVFSDELTSKGQITIVEDLEFAVTKGQPSKHQLFKSLPLVIRPLSTTSDKTKFSRLISRSGACFSKVPKLFGRISGDIILFVSSKRRRIEARNFAVIFMFIAFTTY